MKSTILLLFLFCLTSLQAEESDSIKALIAMRKIVLSAKVKKQYSKDYLAFRDSLAKTITIPKRNRFGQFLPEVLCSMDTTDKSIALTFDACGGAGGNGYDAKLIEYLRLQKIHATLFITGLWIDAHPDLFKQLAADSLFEIENHGLVHRVCSAKGRSIYGVVPTDSVPDIIDEMEINSRKIEKITGKRPKYFRSATAYCDEASIVIAKKLGMQVTSYSVLPGDAISGASADSMVRVIIKDAQKGSIILMHFNKPKGKTEKALEKAIPQLREKGFSFIKLEESEK
jgi:peptidoglycan/xylan/chitin deacetylase (PgdA/CDA1 family)